MKLDLFSTPIWIGNIDSSKIKLEYEADNIDIKNVMEVIKL